MAANVRLEYFDTTGTATAQLLWSGPSVAKAIIPSSVMTSVSAGLTATYFTGTSLTSSAVVRLDNTVNFSWGTGSPDSRVPVDNFSARWTGSFKPVDTATYTFYTDVAGGVRLWINGQQLVNNWTLHSLATNSGKITLTGGTSYDITMEYQVGTQSAVAKLSWSASFAKSIVPQSVLRDRSSAVTPVPVNPPGAPSGLVATPGDGRVNLSWVAPPPDSSAPVTDYIVQYRPTGTTAWTPVDEGSTATTATITGLTNNTSYDFTVTAVNSVGQGPPSAVASTTPTAPPTELLSDPGFESGNGGWVAFKIGTLSRVTSPVHGGSDALRVASPSTSASLVGLTQNAVISNSVAGRSYTASCYVQPTSGSLERDDPVAGIHPGLQQRDLPAEQPDERAPAGQVDSCSSDQHGGQLRRADDPAALLVERDEYQRVAAVRRLFCDCRVWHDVADRAVGPDRSCGDGRRRQRIRRVHCSGVEWRRGDHELHRGGEPGHGDRDRKREPHHGVGSDQRHRYTFTVTATNFGRPGACIGAEQQRDASAHRATQLLPDPGFESGNGGWIAFKVGTLTRVATPVHGGAFALRVAATGSATTLVGLTQNSVVSNSVAGRSYTASCYVRAHVVRQPERHDQAARIHPGLQQLHAIADRDGQYPAAEHLDACSGHRCRAPGRRADHPADLLDQRRPPRPAAWSTTTAR